METAVLCDRGQVTIPKQFRTQLGLTPRMLLAFSVKGDQLVISRMKTSNPFEAARGILKSAKRTDELIRSMRSC